MKVILVNGSPNEFGCTYTALCEVAKAINTNDIDTEIFHIGVDPIAGCSGCGGCGKTNRCVIDDRVNSFLDIAEDVDGFVFGSPVHYASMSGSMTAFMDRAFYANGRSFRLKPAGCIVSARRAGTTAALDQLNKYPLICEMPIVASSYWCMVHGSKPEDVAKDLEGLVTMHTLGSNMAWFLKCKSVAIKHGVSLPYPIKRVATNFIR